MKRRLAVMMAVALAGLAVPVTLHQIDQNRQDASVGNSFTYVYYHNPERVFIYANAGTAHTRFRAHVACGNGTIGDGAWQTQPGPWYGSTANCGNEVITHAGVQFS